MEPKKNKNADLTKKSGMFFAIGLLTSLSLALMAFEWKTYSKGDLMDLGDITDNFEDVIEIQPTEILPPPPPKIQIPQVIEVPDDEVIDEEIDIPDIDFTEDEIIEDISFDEEPAEEEAEAIFLPFEDQAAFPGGKEAWNRFLRKNLKYPKQAIRMGIEGRVFLNFVVAKDGSLSDIKVLRGVGGGCNEEALRVLQNSPKWNPGLQRGNPVKSRMSISIVFKLR